MYCVYNMCLVDDFRLEKVTKNVSVHFMLARNIAHLLVIFIYGTLDAGGFLGVNCLHQAM